MGKPYKDEDYQYKKVDFYDSTDVGADEKLLSPESQATVRGFQDTWAEGDKAYKEAQAAGDQAGMDAAQKMMDEAHAGAEEERAKYGYQGGANGGAFNPLAGATPGQGTAGKADTFTYDSAPEYISKNQQIIDEAMKQLRSRPAFSYDPETDPSYQQYKDQYTRLGEQAMEDTLGQVSARTGGLASSYAGSAAQQSYNQYMSALAGKIPELRQLAYEMYRDEGNDLRSDLNMLLNMEQMSRSAFESDRSQYNTDRSFAYRAWSDQKERDYRAAQDKAEMEYKLTERTHDWDREASEDAVKAHEREVNEAIGIFNATGNVDRLAAAWGLTPEQAQIMIDDYARQKQLTEQEAARQVADWYAQYGDDSKLKEMGVNTDYFRQEQTGQQRNGTLAATPPDEGKYSMNDIDPASVAGLGIANLNFNTIDNLVEEGKLEMYETEDGRLGVRWAEGYDANRWWQESGARINSGPESWKGGNR